MFRLLLCCGCLSALLATAQPPLPPVWGGETATVSRHTGERVQAVLPPVRIVWQNDPSLTEGTENLLRPGNGQADQSGRNLCRLHGGAALLLDFGRELQGGIRLVSGASPGNRPVSLRIRFGESVSEAMSETDGESGATNDHAMRDFTLQVPWLGSAEAGNSGFRFVRIDLPADAVLDLKEVQALFTYRDIPYRGSFRCSDKRLDSIWMTGAYTVHLNMQEYLWDGIKRDRLVWIGDMHPEVMTVNTVFGYHKIVPESLDLVRDLTPLPGWMNGISSYSLWWLLIQRDWFRYQGDLAYLRQQREYLSGLLEHLFTRITPEGREQLDGMRFLDWPSSANPEGVNAGLQALTAMAMDAGAELCRLLDDETLAERCEAQARLLRRHVPDPNGSKQAAALLTLAGMTDAEKTDREILSAGGARGFSTFYGYYMLCAMAEAGNYDGALEIIRTYWGAMLDLGATTFWEDFDLDWLPDAAGIDEPVPPGKKDIHGDFGDYCYRKFRHSLAHGWASGPTAWLSRYVLGVEPLEAGCRKVRIAPRLGDLQWAEGSFPTPQGDIFVRHERKNDGTVRSVVKAPRGVKIVRE